MMFSQDNCSRKFSCCSSHERHLIPVFSPGVIFGDIDVLDKTIGFVSFYDLVRDA